MGRRGLLGATFAVVLLLLPGCGGDGTPEFTGSDEEQIAGTVNAMTAAIAGGDGQVACALMTEEGQQLMLKVGRQAGGPEIDDCVAAVPVAEAAGYDPGDFRITVGDVHVDPQAAAGAEADCDLSGAFLIDRTDAGWRVATPFCSH